LHVRPFELALSYHPVVCCSRFLFFPFRQTGDHYHISITAAEVGKPIPVVDIDTIQVCAGGSEASVSISMAGCMVV
jgi:hypothetical protein